LIAQEGLRSKRAGAVALATVLLEEILQARRVWRGRSAGLSASLRWTSTAARRQI